MQDKDCTALLQHLNSVNYGPLMIHLLKRFLLIFRYTSTTNLYVHGLNFLPPLPQKQAISHRIRFSVLSSDSTLKTQLSSLSLSLSLISIPRTTTHHFQFSFSSFKDKNIKFERQTRDTLQLLLLLLLLNAMRAVWILVALRAVSLSFFFLFFFPSGYAWDPTQYQYFVSKTKNFKGAMI